MTKEETFKYLKENELDVQHAKAALIYAKLIYNSYVNSDRIHGVNYSPIFSYFFKSNSSNFYQIIPRKHIKNVSEKIYLDYCKDPETLENKIKRHEHLDERFDKIWKNYQKRKDNLSAQGLLRVCRDFINILKEWWYYGVIGEDKGEVIVQEVVPRFAKRHGLSLEEAKEIIIVLAHPDTQSIFNLERKDFLNICLEAKKDKKSKKLDQLINNYIKNYFYFKTDFYEAKEITPDDLLKQASKETTDRVDISKEIKTIDDNFKKIHKQKERLLTSLKLTKEDKKDIYFSQRVASWFDQRKARTMVQCYYLYSFLKDIAKKYDLEYHDLAFSTHEELEEFLKGGKLNKTEIEKRNKGMFYVFEKGEVDAKAFYEEASNLVKIATNIARKGLRGQIASTGGLKEIEGVVRVVHNPIQDEFNNGEILVTSMTRIEFVPLMRKARAIITDEGGIVCHAAIISRELNLPCIIGTKNATHILKTEDKIELNLEVGAVRILKNKEKKSKKFNRI